MMCLPVFVLWQFSSQDFYNFQMAQGIHMNTLNLLNWPRIILCGLITGVAYTLLTAVLVGTLGDELLAATANHTSTGEG